MAEVKAVLPELLPGKDTEDGAARAGREDGRVDGDLRKGSMSGILPTRNEGSRDSHVPGVRV